MDRIAQSGGDSDEGDEIDLRQMLTLLLERKGTIVLFVILAVGAALAYLKVTPPIYEATALIEVPQQARSSARFEYAEGEDFRGDEALATIVRNLQRISLFEKVLERAEIKAHPGYQKADRVDSGQPQSELDPAEQLGEWADIRVEKGTRLIAVTVAHSDPDLAKKLANAIVEEFLKEKSEARSGSSESDLEFLVREAERLGTKLQESQAKLQAFDEAIASHDKVKEQDDALEILNQRYGEAHPSVIQARSLLSSLETQYETTLALVRPHLPARENGETDGAAPGSDAEFELLKAHHKIVSGEVDTSQALFEGVLSRMKEADVTKQMDTVAIEVAEEARRPTKPVWPVKSLILGASILLGGAAGFFWVLGRNYFNHSIKTVAEAERHLGIPVVAAIPEDNRLPGSRWLENKKVRRLKELIVAQSEIHPPAGKRRRKSGGTIEPLVALSDSGGSIAEAFRSMRAELTLSGGKEPCQTCMVTSSIPGEGKSFVAANLALTFAAQMDGKTLLIDADLRLPMVGKIYDQDEKPEGLGMVLSKGALDGRWKSAISKSGIANLDLMLAGRQIPNPAELLSGDGFRKLLGELSKEYQRIVIDSAPANTVADSLLIAPHVNTIILVVKANGPAREIVIRSRDLLANAGRPPAGLVLNRLPTRPGLASDPYHYYYNAGGKGYGANYSS